MKSRASVVSALAAVVLMRDGFVAIQHPKSNAAYNVAKTWFAHCSSIVQHRPYPTPQLRMIRCIESLRLLRRFAVPSLQETQAFDVVAHQPRRHG